MSFRVLQNFISWLRTGYTRSVLDAEYEFAARERSAADDIVIEMVNAHHAAVRAAAQQ